jgi:DNA invertase Pin-like site-specific DNA recombinase
MTAPRKTLRCAVYTRKSSEEGLEQEFNSLEAQREACEAYIKSQAHEGWRLSPERFDDGGFSGGSLERPALTRLLEQIREKRIDIIVIYKIDRLTRSLMDFAKLAELFEKEGVFFVSVTQQFNTTTSMGRLMLNVLLSFAQFEREITGERIRDKIAASKKKGMWMGGGVPTGYDVKDRALIINEEGAKTVRTLFRLYTELGTVRKVWAEAQRLNLRTPVRVKSDGTTSGGKLYCSANIYHLLSSPIYIGKLPHKGQVYDASHPALIDTDVWNAVRAKLAANRVDRRYGRNAKHPNPLAGLLFDANGIRFTPTRNGKGHRYYIDPALTTGMTPAKAHLSRIPAIEIEHAARKGLAEFLRDPKSLLAAIGASVKGATAERAIGQARELAADILGATPTTWRPLIGEALERVVLHEDGLSFFVAPSGLSTVLLASGEVNGGDITPKAGQDRNLRSYEYCVPAKIRRRSGVMKLVIESGGGISNSAPDPALIKIVARAHDWAFRLMAGEIDSVRDIAKEESFTDSYVARVLRLGFLPPRVVEAILEGSQPIEWTADRFISAKGTSLLWHASEEHSALRLQSSVNTAIMT